MQDYREEGRGALDNEDVARGRHNDHATIKGQNKLNRKTFHKLFANAIGSEETGKVVNRKKCLGIRKKKKNHSKPLNGSSKVQRYTA